MQNEKPVQPHKKVSTLYIKTVKLKKKITAPKAGEDVTETKLEQQKLTDFWWDYNMVQEPWKNLVTDYKGT